MTPAPTRETPAWRAYNDVRILARRHGRDSAEYFMLYALEGFLARLAASNHSADFVLKGGVLMAAFSARRPTRDIDLAASGFPNDIAGVVQRVRAVATVDVKDGLLFDGESISGVTIRDEADYAGVRVTPTVQLAAARIALHIDVNFGDPIWPEATQATLPLLLGGTLQVRGYPDHMVLAEKIVTAVDRGGANMRWRDFVDIAAIIESRSLRQADLASAIDVVADHRRVTMSPLADVLIGMADIAQPKWAAWRRKQRLEATTPARFQDLLDRCIAFTDPVLGGRVTGFTWLPEARAWQ